ncbi:hypothetical protein [Methylocapsa acidiphila]|uniref:hypothetical protein n=1 Tax=Methylocapsa acidiphila TaxID=133552 RepID=UPI00047AFFD0|nr:hypothetical protein [Methylocapsa acidiphila]
MSIALLVLAVPSAQARTYLFRVSCWDDETYVALWDGGAADLGKTHFRVATGDANQNCSIFDYDPKADASLPRRWCSDPGAAIEFFPPILLMAGATHCR